MQLVRSVIENLRSISQHLAVFIDINNTATATFTIKVKSGDDDLLISSWFCGTKDIVTQPLTFWPKS